MEQTKQNIIAGIIIILASLGITATPGILDNELADYYICDKTDEISEFKGGISGTSYSGYPFTDSRKGATYCGTSEDKGNWIKLNKYAEDNDLDVYELILNQESNKGSTPNIGSGKKEICHPNAIKCVAI